MRNVVIAGVLAFAVIGGVNAQEVYGGLGTGGVTLGMSKSIAPNVLVRADWTGGLSLSKNGVREGVDFSGKFKMSRLGAYADYFPSGSGFRVTGGLTYNDTSFKLNSRGGNGTIGGKPVDLSNAYFNLAIEQPKVTPYIGIGYKSSRDDRKGWGYHADVGFQLGAFDTTVRTNVVGMVNNAGQVITEDDVKKETESVTKAVQKLKFLPSIQVGATYRF